MKTRFEVMLSCGTITIDDNVWENTHHHCPIHNVPDTIDAIETREWHVRCQMCRFGKWVGNSVADARIAERKHLTSKPGHHVQYGFVTPDDIREKWRSVFGRKRYPRRFINTHEREHATSVYARIAAQNAPNEKDDPSF